MLVDLVIQVLLSPILVCQGLVARACVQQMPEPPGPRSGVLGEGPVIRLLVFGDSAAAGVGAAHLDEAVLGQLTTRLAQGARVEFDMVAKTGARTRDALEWLNNLPRDRYDVVLTSLGVNDVTKCVPRARWLQQQTELIERFTKDHGVRQILITGLPPMGCFPSLPNPLRWVVGRRAKYFDQGIKALINTHPISHHIPVAPVLDPDHMAIDGFHPGPAVHAVWADMAEAAIRRHPRVLDAGKATA